MLLENDIRCGVVLFIFVVVGGCATTAGYEQRVATWLGASEASLVNAWGIPDGSYQTVGRKYLTYNSSRAYTTPVSTDVRCSTSAAGATNCYTSTFGGNTYNYSCKTTFHVENSRVIGYEFKGNDCTAVALKSDNYGSLDIAPYDASLTRNANQAVDGKVWCATSTTVKLTKNITCLDFYKGKPFKDSKKAAAEHRRLSGD